MLPVQYRMINQINDRKFEVTGVGAWYPDGSSSTSVNISDLPKDWCGTLLPCICSGPREGAIKMDGGADGAHGLINYAPYGYHTDPGTLRRSTLWDDSGQIIARVSATGLYRKTSRSLDYQIDVETETKAGSIISELSSVDSYSFTVLPKGRGRAQVLTHFTLSTGYGRKAHGAAIISYKFIRSRAAIPDIIMGRNQIRVHQIGNNIQWLIMQATEFQSELGLTNPTIKPYDKAKR